MKFTIQTEVVKDSGVLEFKAKDGKEIKYRIISVFGRDDSNVIQMSVPITFDEIPLKVPVEMDIDLDKPYDKIKLTLEKLKVLE